MFGNNRDSMRRYYLQCWQKLKQNQSLDGLEQQVARVIEEHPEYHAFLDQNEQVLQRDYLPENGESNPFLHLGLHLGIREQAATDRPVGIATIYQRLTAKHGVLEAEHRMMECLAESIWLAQRNHTVPDEAVYLECLKKL